MYKLIFSGMLAFGLIFYGCGKDKDTDVEADADTDADADADSEDTGPFLENGPQLQFASDFITEYCNAWGNCLTTTCDIANTEATDTGVDCVGFFDQTAADDCTSGTFICNTMTATVDVPAECANVCP